MSFFQNHSDWPLVPLKKVATLKRGYDLPVGARNEGTVPIYAANGRNGAHDELKIKGPGVITGRSGTIGKVHYCEEGFWPLNTALYVMDFHGNHPRWVYYMLSSFKLERFSEGAGVPTLNRNLIHDEMIPLPPLPEQKRIADILDKADAIRRKRQQAIQLADDFLRAVFLDMFGDPVTNPKGWPLKPLGSLVINKDGQRRPIKASDRADIAGEYPYYGASGVIDYVNGFIFEGPHLLIGEDGANLIARSTPIAFIAEGRYWVNNHAHVLGEKDGLSLDYLAFSINMRSLEAFVSGSAQPKLNQENLNKIPVQIPPPVLIESFLAVLKKHQAYTGRVSTSAPESLFVSLSQIALSGQL